MDELGIPLHPKVIITPKQEIGNIFIAGAQGAGKSVIFKPILSYLLARGDHALIYDAKREYTELFYGQDNLLLSPSDKRSLAWDISSDISSDEIAYEIACSLIIANERDPYWSNSARLIVAGAFVVLMKTEIKWSWLELKELLEKPFTYLNEIFSIHYPKAAQLIEDDSKTTHSIMSFVATNLVWLDYVAKVWTSESKYKFSITKWIGGKYKIQSLIIPNDPLRSTISTSLCSAVMALVTKLTIDLPDSRKRKFWFVIDELADLPKTESLEKWLSLTRSKGGRTLAATQANSQLESIYGDKNAETLMGLFSNLISLKIGSSYNAAKKVSDTLGKRYVKRATINYDKEGNRSTSYQQSEEYVVRPEQLMQLPSPNKQGVKGYLSVTGWNAVYELVWSYPQLEKIAESYIPIDTINDDETSLIEPRKRRNRGRHR